MTTRRNQSVSDYQSPVYNKHVDTAAEPLLSPQRAFVVQFREGMDATLLRFSGRVEHMTSGLATRFHSPEELLTFLAEVLSTLRAKPP